jgi:hypothetical protein
LFLLLRLPSSASSVFRLKLWHIAPYTAAVAFTSVASIVATSVGSAFITVHMRAVAWVSTTPLDADMPLPAVLLIFRRADDLAGEAILSRDLHAPQLDARAVTGNVAGSVQILSHI